MHASTSHKAAEFAQLVLLQPHRQLPRQCIARDGSLSDKLCPTVWLGWNINNCAGQNTV